MARGRKSSSGVFGCCGTAGCCCFDLRSAASCSPPLWRSSCLNVTSPVSSSCRPTTNPVGLWQWQLLWEGECPAGLGALAGDLLGLKSSGDLFVGILRSRTVQDDLINKFDLRTVYSSSHWKSVRKTLAANTVIAEDRKTGIIFISVTDGSPDRAAQMAREYVTELNSVVNQLSTSSAHRERVFLEERLQQVKQDLDSAEKEFGDFASKNTAIDIKEQGKAMVDSAAKLQGEVIATQSELEGLKKIYTEGNVRIRALRAKIAELNSQLQKLGGEPGVQTGSEAPANSTLYPSIRKLPLLGIPYADFYRRTKVQEAVFETLTQEYELAKVAEAREIPPVKVLDPPEVPEERVFPPRKLIAALGAIFALIVGAAWVLARARWRVASPRGADPPVRARCAWNHEQLCAMGRLEREWRTGIHQMGRPPATK